MVEEGVVFGMVASVCDSGVELLVVLLNLGDEAVGKGGIVVVVVVVEAVSSSVICDLKEKINQSSLQQTPDIIIFTMLARSSVKAKVSRGALETMLEVYNPLEAFVCFHIEYFLQIHII